MNEFDLIIHYDRIGESDMYNCHTVGKLVRCKDCKWYSQFISMTGKLLSEGRCEYHSNYFAEDDYCSKGERKESEK